MGWVHPRTNEIAAGLEGVQAAVEAQAHVQHSKVMAKAANHVDTGRLISNITVRRHNKGQAIVFKDPNILSINYGHFTKDGTWVEGIHIIEEALS
ncbi:MULTISPECIES: DUF5403 family protein [Streptomyces]|uniref:DUF5403 family protein n=1 Tax=Streptomyces TaxID=1883 RepID=UPI0036A7C63B